MAKFTELGRIDRAVADNISDIKESFDDYAGLVQDFIVFISRQIKYDLFGFTSFTIADFSKSSGRNRQDLVIKHPLFANTKRKAPEVKGLKFDTVFDYGLYLMLKNNLVFKNEYRTKEGNKEVVLSAIRVITEVKFEFDRSNKGVKRYHVKISPELLDGFIKRYYTLDVNAYAAIGKGRGGDNRKTLMIYLSRLRHILWSTKQESATLPIDELCKYLENRPEENKYKKRAIERMLKGIKEKGMNFEYDFTTNGTAYQYYVKFTFPKPPYFKAEHDLYYDIMESLKIVFAKSNFDKTKDNAFQEWMTDNRYSFEEKVSVIKTAYHKVFNEKISDKEAVHFIQSGLQPL